MLSRYTDRGNGAHHPHVQMIVPGGGFSEHGWRWVPCMTIGSGCKVHLRADELPDGNLIVRLSRHLACVRNGVLHDNHDSSRGGTRCCYGYYTKEIER